jgi:hypothetical protein
MAASVTPAMTGSERPPGVVLAAAVITWTVASIIVVFTVGLGVLVLLLGGPFFDAFQAQQMQGFVVVAALLIVAFALAADVLALLVFRGHRWARWTLVVFSVASAACGAMLGYYVAPLAITVAALAVIVLLFLRPARAWFRSNRN